MTSFVGPHAEDCYELIERALTMSRDEAIMLSRVYEDDENDAYLAHCAIVRDALDMTERGVEPGWFASIFRYQDWAEDTKALHAVADAAMAMLVADVIPSSVVEALTRPWISQQVLVVGRV